MALVTRVAAASLDASTGMFAPQISGDLIAGAAIDAVAPCYIKAADGKVYMSNAAAADEVAGFDGFSPKAYVAGAAVTLFGVGARFQYGTGLTPGAKYFIGATAGRLDTVATVGDAVGVARAINATDIRVTRNV